MKKIFSLVVMMFIALTFVLTGCSPKGLEDNPDTKANVVSNGGMTVVKGDYLYYVNGYQDRTLLTSGDNDEGEIERSGIYRTKLNNAEISKDKDGFLTKTEQVVSKVVGFDNGGFYILGDYIYYGTPYMKLSSDGKLQSDRVEFHRINIDGTDDEKFYVTDKAETNLEWTMYFIGNTPYLVTYCDSKIITVNASTGKVVASIENSTSHAFYYEEDFNMNGSRDSEMLKYVYYTRAISADDNASSDFKGNVVCRLNVATGETEVVNSASKDYTYTIKGVEKDRVYYTKQNSTISGLSLLYKKDIYNSWANANEVKLTNVEYTNYYFCNYGMSTVIASDGTTTRLVTENKSTQILSSAPTIASVNGGYAYLIENNQLYRIDLNAEPTNGDITKAPVTSATSTNIITDARFVDFDNQRIYVYTGYTAESDASTNYYLNYVSDMTLEQRFVGKFECNELPAKPEADKTEDEENADEKQEEKPWID